MGKKQELDGFDIVVADHRNSTSYFEETDGTHRQWGELSAEGKLAYIARDAAMYDVPFERFAQAVRDVLGGQPSAVREDAALRLALSNERELHGLAALLPPDHSGTWSTPLLERFKELLEWQADRTGPAAGGDVSRFGDLAAHDTVEPTRIRLEAFGDEFERLAATPTPALVEQFQEMLGQPAERSAMPPEKEPQLPADQWQYRIAPHRRRPDEFTWEPATDGTADTWFLFGEKGEDRRCFGVFSSRAGAEHALDIVKSRETEQHKDKGRER